MRIAKYLSLTLSLVFLSACSTRVPATVTRHPHVPLEKGSTLYVIASEQHPRIMQSLRAAGLEASGEWSGAGYVLEVVVGNSRGSRDCGSVNNVRYDLKSGRQVILIMKGRGLTGSCPDNVFDDMSRKLATYL